MKHATAQPRPVTDSEVQQARDRLARLEAGLADGPAQRARYATAREELADLEARLADQQRAAVAESITGDLDAAAARLAATRNRISSAAAAHMDALAELLTATEEHNTAVASARTLLDCHGLTARAHDREGTIGSAFDRTAGARVAGVDWAPVIAEAITAYALRLLFARAYGRASPLANVLAHYFYPHKCENRPDGIVLPGVPRSFTLHAPPAPAPAVPASLR